MHNLPGWTTHLLICQWLFPVTAAYLLPTQYYSLFLGKINAVAKDEPCRLGQLYAEDFKILVERKDSFDFVALHGHDTGAINK